MRAFIALFTSLLLCIIPAAGQFNNGRTGSVQKTKKTDAFNSGRAGNFNDYRVSLNAEYARRIKEQEWKEHRMKEGERAPDRDIKPVSPIKWEGGNDDRKGQEIEIDEVVKPIKDKDKARPIAPVIVPEDEGGATDLNVSYLGSTVRLHAPASKLSLSSTSQDALADAWTRLSQPEYAGMVADCIKYKQQAGLCDWAFMLFLESVAKATASDNNAVAAIMTYIASQAGYTVRLATTASGQLDMMFASQHLLYDRPYIIMSGTNYYPYFTKSQSYNLCQSNFKTETGLSLWIPRLPQVGTSVSDTRTVQSKRYPEFRTNSSVNKNLISFFDTYPTSVVGSNPVSRWAMYANTPVSTQIRQTLYPQLKQLTSGMTPYEAVQRILNWIQTGFIYEYDDKVWGGDRAFFAEETLYYPYCDCEDRSILLTRIVRDLFGLKCLLVFYPGHLAAAINFPTEVGGDYISYGGNKFTITDPTYIGAPIGSTMPEMDNSTAKIILLD